MHENKEETKAKKTGVKKGPNRTLIINHQDLEREGGSIKLGIQRPNRTLIINHQDLESGGERSKLGIQR
ncbi:hypothetical protein OSTOST_09929 [Ostertagia ostertagi]